MEYRVYYVVDKKGNSSDKSKYLRETIAPRPYHYNHLPKEHIAEILSERDLLF